MKKRNPWGPTPKTGTTDYVGEWNPRAKFGNSRVTEDVFSYGLNITFWRPTNNILYFYVINVKKHQVTMLFKDDACKLAQIKQQISQKMILLLQHIAKMSLCCEVISFICCFSLPIDFHLRRVLKNRTATILLSYLCQNKPVVDNFWQRRSRSYYLLVLSKKLGIGQEPPA